MQYKLFTLLTLALLCFSANAQKTIAVLSGNNWTFYTDFSAALNQSASGSTIYLPGGTFVVSQGNDTINKSINIIGVGHFPDSTAATNQTILQGALYLTFGADVVNIEGIKITSHIQILDNPQHPNFRLDYFSIKRSAFISFILSGNTNGGLIDNIQIDECIINWNGTGGGLGLAVGGYFQGNFNVKRSIITTQLTNALKYVNFYNCIFLSTSGTPVYCDYCYIQNNIFCGSQIPNMVYTTFTNNLIFTTSALPPSGSYSYGYFYNNINNATLATTFQNVTSNSFNYLFNYALNSSSNGKNAGTDGTDIGIHGTIEPFKLSSVPSNPHISSKVISSSSTSNGTLPVSIRVIAQNH